MFSRYYKIFMELLQKTSKKLLWELDSMEDRMDQSKHQTHQIFQALHVLDQQQQVLLNLEHSHGGIYMRTTLDLTEMVLMVGKPTILMNLHQIYYGIELMTKLLVINHHIVLDK